MPEPLTAEDWGVLHGLGINAIGFIRMAIGDAQADKMEAQTEAVFAKIKELSKNATLAQGEKGV